MQRKRGNREVVETGTQGGVREYIKICPEEAEEMNVANAIDDGDEVRERKVQGNRFTFNRISQDVIKEEEEEFYKVDYDQIIELKNKVNAYKIENERLVQESAENIQLFNSYMQEMEQRMIQKNGEIQSLKFRLKNAEQKYSKCEEQLKKLEFKILSDLNIKNTPMLESAERSAQEIRPVFKLSRAENIQRSSRKQEKGEGIGDSKDIQIRVLEKENHQMHRDIMQLKENHRNLAQSFEKELQMRKIEQQYSQTGSVYYRTLNNSPRASLKPKNKSIISDNLRLQFATNTSLNALISPRTNSTTPLSFFQPNVGAKTGRMGNLPSAPKEKTVSRSTYLNDGGALHFGKDQRVRYSRQERKF